MKIYIHHPYQKSIFYKLAHNTTNREYFIKNNEGSIFCKYKNNSDVEFIFKKEIRSKEDLSFTLDLINKYKIIKECYKKAEHFINLASNSLSIFRNNEEKKILEALTSFSLERSF